MGDINDIVRLIKKAAVDAFRAEKPAKIIVGIVTSEEPLKVKVSEKIVITGEQLMCPEYLTDHDIKIKDGDNEKTYKYLNALKNGDKVCLISNHGGQQFFVLDRVEV